MILSILIYALFYFPVVLKKVVLADHLRCCIRKFGGVFRRLMGTFFALARWLSKARRRFYLQE